MTRLRSLLARLLRRGRHVDGELAEEIDSHLHLHIEDNLRAGMTADEARRHAVLALGGVEQTKELVRDAHATWVESVWRDAAFAARVMRRSPVVTAAAVLSLGLGIGATVAIVAFADAALVRSLPVPRASELSVLVWQARSYPPVASWSVIRESPSGHRASATFSYGVFRRLEQAAEPMATLAAHQRIPPVTTVTRGEPGTAECLLVSGRFFETLGVGTATGRPLLPVDDRPDAVPALVVSHRLWRQRFGGDPRAIGSAITVNGHVFTIVGVAAPSFFGVRPGTWVDLYLPLSVAAGVDPELGRRATSPLANPRLWWLQVLARRASGTAVADLERRLDRGFAQALDPAWIKTAADRPRLSVRDGRRGEPTSGDLAQPIAVLLALASTVLLVACANVGNLLLARTSARRQEWAMRLALGANRRRLARQHLTEGGVLGLLGGLVGLAMAAPFARGLGHLFAQGRSDRGFDVPLDLRLWVLAASVTVIAGLVLGLVPAATLVGRSAPKLASLGDRATSPWRRRAGLARPLVAAQMAGTVVVLALAGLFARSLQNLHAVPLGFDPDRIILIDIDPVRAGHGGARRLPLLEGITETLATVPQVQSVTRSSLALVDDRASADIVRIPGRTVDTNDIAYWLDVGPRFHETLRIPLIIGRTIDRRDHAGAPRVAVINETFAKTYFPGEVPLGRQVQMDYPQPSAPYTVVGIVGDSRYSSVRESTGEPVIYLPDTQRSRGTATVLAIRVEGRVEQGRRRILETLRRTHPTVALTRVRTYGEQIDDRLATDRLLSVLSITLGSIALALSAVGLYGIMAFAVARRTSEIGIRTALGATRGAVVGLVLRDSALVVGCGVAIGAGLALWATRLVHAQVFGLTPTDPWTLAAAVAAVCGVAGAAAYLPARQASRVDPTIALRDQ